MSLRGFPAITLFSKIRNQNFRFDTLFLYPAVNNYQATDCSYMDVN